MIEFVGDSTVQLVDFMGGDLAVVNAARVSFAAEHQTEMHDQDFGLINFLMKNRHGTPFESTVFTFRMETPIFVAREWFRHRIGSFNEMSGRYKELPPRFYLPEKARVQTGKPGAYVYEDAPHLDFALHDELKTAYNYAWQTYQALLQNGVAKEQARLVLPVAIMTQFYWIVNARSLMNFLNLRLSQHAMKEIRDCALKVWDHFVTVMPHTGHCFTENGLVCP
jgi:thymidylate synthase (FAD)